jgi:hypothetical protein
MKRLFFAITLSLAAASAIANGPHSFEWERSASVQPLYFPPLDLNRLAAEDSVSEQIKGRPFRFAVGHDVAITPWNAGEWSDDGRTARWSLPIHADDAAHINLGFSQFTVGSGQLQIVAQDGSVIAGPYRQRDVPAHGQLWTPVLMGEKSLVVLEVPSRERARVNVLLSRVGHGYRGFGIDSIACRSGACNTDVACLGASDPWNQQRRSVGAITVGGTDTCSGSLLNNTANDRRMLFATATHCGIATDTQAAATLVYWKYESATCRQPGSSASGAAAGPKPNTNSAGLRVLARTNNPFSGATPANTRSDFTLLELVTPPAGNTFDLYWSGWDRREPTTTCTAPPVNDPNQTSGRCASIHHPGVDEKRITFVEIDMVRDNISGAQNVHWRAEWDPTPARLPGFTADNAPPSVTEGGSSGSPLYSAQRRLVGVLSGGPSACGATGVNLRDQYGGLFHAWDGLGTTTTAMRTHLDPVGSNPEFIDGIGAGGTYTVNAPAQTAKACAGQTGSATIRIASADGASAPVSLSSPSAPAAFGQASFAPNPAVPSSLGTPVLITVPITAGSSGTANLPVRGESTDGVVTGQVSFQLFNGLPGAVSLTAPVNGATDVPLNQSFSWTSATNVDSYRVEFSRSADFASIAFSGNVTGTSFSTNSLRRNAQYFWRVVANNPCGGGLVSSGSFTTVANDTILSDGFFD